MKDVLQEMFKDNYIVEFDHDGEIHYVADGDYATFKGLNKGQVAIVSESSIRNESKKHGIDTVLYYTFSYPSAIVAKESVVKLYEQLKKDDKPSTYPIVKSLENVRIVNKNTLFNQTIDVDIKNTSENPVSYEHVKVTDPVNVDVTGLFETCRDTWGGIYSIQRDSDLHKLLEKYAVRDHAWLNYDDIDFPEADENGDGDIYDILQKYDTVKPPCQVDLSLTICLE